MNMIFHQEKRGLERLTPGTLQKVRVGNRSVVEAAGGGQDVDELFCCIVHLCCAWIFLVTMYSYFFK